MWVSMVSLSTHQGAAFWELHGRIAWLQQPEQSQHINTMLKLKAQE